MSLQCPGERPGAVPRAQALYQAPTCSARQLCPGAERARRTQPGRDPGIGGERSHRASATTTCVQRSLYDTPRATRARNALRARHLARIGCALSRRPNLTRCHNAPLPRPPAAKRGAGRAQAEGRARNRVGIQWGVNDRLTKVIEPIGSGTAMSRSMSGSSTTGTLAGGQRRECHGEQRRPDEQTHSENRTNDSCANNSTVITAAPVTNTVTNSSGPATALAVGVAGVALALEFACDMNARD
jgi:hypothetical protein